MAGRTVETEHARHVAAYVRVSTRTQDLGMQRRAVDVAARARGQRIGRWFEEKRSASTVARPELAKLREAVRRGEVRTLYVFRLDRLARSGIRDTLSLLEELRGAGCSVLTVADGFDLSGPAAEVVIAVIAWAAQMERSALGERISAARARVEAEGRSWGRPRRAGAELVQRVRKLRAEGRSLRAIAIAVKMPRATVAAVVSEKGAYARARAQSTKPAVARARAGGGRK